MAHGASGPLARFIRRLSGPGTGAPSDGELLAAFVTGGDESAFADLVRRHGPMVLNVCSHMLDDAHAAEDVFQATFLVLIRKAKSIGKPESVGSWLHGVAVRLAAKARGDRARRRDRERQAPRMASIEASDEALWRDLRPVLHEEVENLPARYRAPFVLCYLEGKTNEEAAALLGWPKGTVLSSLSRARERLRQRLTRRGIVLSAAALGTLVSERAAPAAVPTALIDATVSAGSSLASGTVAVSVMAHVDGLARTMLLARLKTSMALAVVAGAALGIVAYRPWTKPEIAIGPEAEQTPAIAREALPMPRTDEQRLQGVWVVVSASQRGEALDAFAGDRLTCAGGDFALDARRGELRYLFRRGVNSGKWKIDDAAEPKALDMVEAGRTLRCVYRLDGDEWQLCVGDPDLSERPTTFLSQPEDRRLVLLLRRDRAAKR